MKSSSVRSKRWTVALPNPAAGELAQRLKTSPVIAQVLLNRGLRDLSECQGFLRPNLTTLHDPCLLGNLDQAAGRIVKAIRDKEKIVIYGDYDVDGITATAILWHAITILGGEVDYYVPHRIDEGYGLNSEAIAQLCDQGAKLIITVDCGITAHAPAEVARSHGTELIITDHHDWQSTVEGLPHLPGCHSIVHPRLPLSESPYPNPYLCGSGVAFKLAWRIGTIINGQSRVTAEYRDFLVEATALAALGTIADVVPLVGENRILAHFGLGGLKQSQLVGIRALIESAGLTGHKIDSYHVGFLLAPRLNACGRMGHARLAIDMLTRADIQQAIEIATYLEGQNKQRQAIERTILDQAIAQVTEHGFDREDCHGIVLGAEGWHPGVIGIVASRLVDRFHRPTVMVALNESTGQGSGRSIPGFHLARALESCSTCLEGFGGHEMAAGLKLDRQKFEEFRKAFCIHAKQNLSPELLVPELKLECAADLIQMTPALITELQRLGPFGHGNRRPILCCRDLEVATIPRRVGKTGDHLQILVRQGPTSMKCIAFNYGSLFDRLQPGVRIDLAVEPILNEFNGRTAVELEVRDLKFPAP